MEIVLYNTVDNENVINKSLTEKYVLDIKLKNDTSIIEPLLILNDKKTMNFQECNYCFISEFDRYYFIRSIESMNNNLWGLRLECDVLESFKDDILNSHAEYKRTIKEGDFLDFNAVTDLRKDIDIYDSNVTISGNKNIVFSTIGGAD